MGVKGSPGPDAHRAFRLGMVTAGLGGFALVALLYVTDGISFAVLAFLLVVLFPVYLLVAASILSVWLGFDKDVTDLRRVYRERDGP